jgi:L-lactate utilization protein LutB
MSKTASSDTTSLARSGRTSRLGTSLRRLQQAIQSRPKPTAVNHVSLKSWREQWSAQRDRIAQRLEMIDSQLEECARASRPRPQLAVLSDTGSNESPQL